MHFFSITAAVLWAIACLAGAFLLSRKRTPGGLPPHLQLVITGLILLAIAPFTYLLVLLLSGAPSVLPSSLQIGGAVLCFAAALRARSVWLDPESHASTVPFAAKSAMVVFVGLCLLALSYFGKAWGATPEQSFVIFLSSVSILIVLMIVGHVIIAMFHGPFEDLDQPADERDRAISLRSMRNAYYVLAAAFWSVPFIIVVPLPTLTALNLWFAALITAELVYYGSVIALYRYGTV